VPVQKPIPVTFLTGFLGAGKTTLLNRILKDPKTPPAAVIVNEFGALGIDGRLIVGVQEELVELANGCICCEIREDLRKTVLKLLEQRQRWWRPLKFEHILVETSGLAVPGPLIQTLLIDPTLQQQTAVSQVITLVHSGKILQQLVEHPEVAAQLACADQLILNHSDQGELPAAVIQELAPLARWQRAVRAEVEVGPLLEPPAPVEWCFVEQVSHSKGILIWCGSGGELELAKLKMFLQFIEARRGWEILRLKGIFRCRGLQDPVVAQGVYQWLELKPEKLVMPEQSRLVVIGRGLDLGELERGWRAIGGKEQD
jgi:G3E family GTPase